MAKEKKLFIPITKRPETGDKWFTLKKYGGYSPCIPGYPQAWNGSALNNCVGFGWGAAAWREDDPECKIGCAKGNDYPGDAWTWYKNSIAQGYEVGQTPKLGAIAVWSRKNEQGHIESVEKVYDDSSWDGAGSGYKTSPSFWTRHYNAKSYRPGYTFIGFIYLKYEFVEKLEPELKPEPKFKIGDEVIINGSLYKSANAAKPSGSVKNKKTKITRYIADTIHPYNTTGDLGWMNEDDITLVTPTPAPTPSIFKLGDFVQIMSSGNSRADGKGSTAYGIRYKRYIIGIENGKTYPYKVGTKSGVVTGYYKAEALRRM